MKLIIIQYETFNISGDKFKVFASIKLDEEGKTCYYINEKLFKTVNYIDKRIMSFLFDDDFESGT